MIQFIFLFFAKSKVHTEFLQRYLSRLILNITEPKICGKQKINSVFYLSSLLNFEFAHTFFDKTVSILKGFLKETREGKCKEIELYICWLLITSLTKNTLLNNLDLLDLLCEY